MNRSISRSLARLLCRSRAIPASDLPLDQAKVISRLTVIFLARSKMHFPIFEAMPRAVGSTMGGRSRKHQLPLCGGEPAQPHRVQCRPPFSSDVQSGASVAAAMMDQCFEELGVWITTLEARSLRCGLPFETKPSKCHKYLAKTVGLPSGSVSLSKIWWPTRGLLIVVGPEAA